MRRVDVPTLRAAWWASRALHRARRPGGALTPLPPPPPLDDAAVRGVKLGLRLGRANCLQRSRVIQAWELAHGRPCEVVIGVSRPSGGFSAHAWLARPGEDSPAPPPFAEIVRVDARGEAVDR